MSPITGRQEAGGGTVAIEVESAPRPVASAVRTTDRIRVDGRLEEAGWLTARPITNFVQSQPNEGMPPSEPTVVRVLYDESNLYVGAVAYDSDPSGLVINTLEHDLGAGASTRDMDIFAITLDTFLDRKSSFMFLVSPGGAFKDGQTFNDSRTIDFAWRAVAEVRTVVHDSGYTVEMAIPWTTLRFDPSDDAQSWGLNMLRRIRRKSEDSYWAPVDRRDPVHRMSKAGTLTGLVGLRPGMNLQFKPFVVGANVSGTGLPPERDDFEFDGGLDVKYGITPGLTLDGTLRTDFSQVEVDQEQVNVTRFPLFFPERRDFFVENSGSFVFGDVTERNYRMGSSLRDFTLFHSRRIGLSANREPIPILGGGRLSGRAGDYEVGLLNVQTQADGDQPAENFAVARLRRNVGPGEIGAMVVNREATGSLANGEYNRSFGVDASVRVLGGLIVNTYLAGTTDSDPADNSSMAGRVAVGYRDRLWNTSAFFKQVGEGFNPGVGFVRRRGIRHAYATFGAHPRPRIPHVQEVNPYAEFSRLTDLANDVVTRRATLAFGVQFLDGGRFDLRAQNRVERLDAPFEIGDDAVVPVGRHEFNEATVSYSSNRARAISGSLTVTGGGFFNGNRLSATTRGVWRAHYRATFDISLSRNDIDLPGGSTTADVYGARVRLASSTALFASAFVQYNTQSDQVVTNVRVNWIYAPLSDVFLVFTERRDVTSNVTLDRAVTLKVTKLLAF